MRPGVGPKVAQVIMRADDLAAQMVLLRWATAPPGRPGRRRPEGLLTGYRPTCSQHQSRGTRRLHAIHLYGLNPHQCPDVAGRHPILIPHRSDEVASLHRPVNNQQESARQRRRAEPDESSRGGQAAGSTITVWPRRSSWATRRRVCASSLRLLSQSGPRSWKGSSRWSM